MERDMLASFKELEKQFFILETDDKIFELIRENKDLCDKVFDSIKSEIQKDNYNMVYQPHIKNGLMVGAEALFRMTVGDVNISPMSVFRLASFYGYEEELTLKILKQICKDTVEFVKKISPDFVVSVNVNPAIFKHEFCEKFLNITQERSVTNNIAIELLEVTSLNNVSKKDFDYIKSNGIKMYLDDFGSGYADESALKFPFDVIKFFGGLISGIDQNPENMQTVKRVAKLCNKRGIGTIAEHVETEEELNACIKAGVKTFQGYYFSKPILCKELIDKYAANITV